jgi:hypothetical protein
MGESHTKGPQLHRPVIPEDTTGQSSMARVSNGKPFKPYVYGGGDKEPAAVTAALERHRQMNAEIERRRALAAAEAMPDGAPGMEWYNELADENAGPP